MTPSVAIGDSSPCKRGAIAVESLDTQSARTIPNCHLIPRPEPGLAIGCDYTGGSPLPTRER
ncbi:MAG: hypothetical protein IJY31_06240 [Muribaculaceae bacterium]|nr:hypothetical protein [Muribaculaceae bacterium]